MEEKEIKTEEKQKEVKIPLFIQIVASMFILCLSLLKFLLNGDVDSSEAFTFSISEVVMAALGFMFCYAPSFLIQLLEKYFSLKNGK